MITKQDIKLTIRYIVLVFIMYLAYMISSPEWLLEVKELDASTISVIFGSVFGAFGWVLKSHFETTPSKD